MMKAEMAFDELLTQVDRLLAPDAAGVDRSDVVAGLLATLARRMTDLYEAREREVASFHAWLEERLGCPINDLAGKTSVQEYYEQADADALLAVIARNHPRRTSLNVKAPRGYGARNPDRDLIVDAYERSMSILLPVMEQIRLTDRLIDLIVYRLHGLTESEMALVDAETGYTAGIPA
ncbi:MAG: hypothetical protein ACREK1_11980 [Longimicrobiales bacterium]